MCTLTWTRDSKGGLDLYFNRDELKTREVAEAPKVFKVGETRFLSPIDPQGGGTWMLANEHGVVVCLLNKWELQGREVEAPLSRGKLVLGMAGVKSLAELPAFLEDLEHYHAFTLALLTPEGDCCWQWDGSNLQMEEMPPFLTSSSFRFEEVSKSRAACFAEGSRGREFHASPNEVASAYSVRMNRPDAQTWSRSHLRVDREISWEYLAEQEDFIGEPVKSLSQLPVK